MVSLPHLLGDSMTDRSTCRVRAVIRELCVEPFVQRSNEIVICRPVRDLPAAVDVAIGNLEATDAPGELIESRHAGAVDRGRVVEIAGGELPGYLGQVFTNRPDLISIDRVERDHGLHSPVFGLDERVTCPVQVERHDPGARLPNLGLTLLLVPR